MLGDHLRICYLEDQNIMNTQIMRMYQNIIFVPSAITGFIQLIEENSRTFRLKKYTIFYNLLSNIYFLFKDSIYRVLSTLKKENPLTIPGFPRHHLAKCPDMFQTLHIYSAVVAIRNNCWRKFWRKS